MRLDSIPGIFQFFLLCVTNALYDKEEFDTDCSRGFLKSLNRILSAFLFVGLLTFRRRGGGGLVKCKIESL